MIYVLSIDPGETTGWAFGQIDVDQGLMKVSTGQERWTPGGLMLVLQTMLPDVLVYESFQYRNKSRSGLVLYSVQLIGVMELYGEMHDECKLVPQTPATAIGQFYDNRKLREGLLYKSTTGGHANDACRHLLQWYTFRGGSKWNKKGFEPA